MTPQRYSDTACTYNNVHTILVQSTGQAPPVSLWQRRGTVAVVYGSCAAAGIAVAAAWYGRYRSVRTVAGPSLRWVRAGSSVAPVATASSALVAAQS
eukprot:COSAG02_NODE_1864_length_10606_cov_17.350148_8_plen_97_part_00